MMWVAVFLLAACATMQDRSDKEVVAERAQTRWNALVAGDFKTAYEMISPAGRTVVSQEGWAGTLKRGFWKGARVTDVDCASPEMCEVRLEIEYAFRGSNIKTPYREKWVKQDGEWWFLLQG